MKKATAVQNRSRGLGEICASSLIGLGKIALRQLVQQSTLAGEIPGHDKNLIKEELDKFALRKNSPGEGGYF